MKRWLLLLGILGLSACASPPTPLPLAAERSPSPPTALVATLVPIPTLLPTVTVALPALTAVTATPLALSPTRGASTPQPAAKFAPPVPVGPKPPDRFNNGNDIKFVYQSVGRLEPNQCYLLHIELVNPDVNPGNRGDDFLDADSCGDPGPAGRLLNFVLYRGKFTNSPNYGTILQQALAPSPEVRLMKMTWTLRVVQNKGRAADGVHYNTIPLSPNSSPIEFEFIP